MTVADLLDASRKQHLIYRGLVKRVLPPAARAAMEEALRLRLEADALDPTHADPAWNGERTTTNYKHDVLIEWYQSQLAKDLHATA